jgi:hypothetical protein
MLNFEIWEGAFGHGPLENPKKWCGGKYFSHI